MKHSEFIKACEKLGISIEPIDKISIQHDLFYRGKHIGWCDPNGFSVLRDIEVCECHHYSDVDLNTFKVLAKDFIDSIYDLDMVAEDLRALLEPRYQVKVNADSDDKKLLTVGNDDDIVYVDGIRSPSGSAFICLPGTGKDDKLLKIDAQMAAYIKKEVETYGK